MKRQGLWKGKYSVHSHMFRKIFETEADPPDRGINKRYVAFMTGRSSGGGLVNQMQVVGGVYLKTHKIYPEVIEKEYEKLGPYINIYSGKAARGSEGLSISEEDMDTLQQVLRLVKQGKIKISL